MLNEAKVAVSTHTERLDHGPLSESTASVFIVGAPRSGTTALARALANHSEFWASEETHILYPLFGDGRLVREFSRWSTERTSPTWLQAQHVGLDEFLEYIGLGLNALFAQRSWGKRWIDHTPYYALMIDILVRMFPSARFLHILRDGRSVVHSMVNVAATLAEDERGEMLAGDFLPDWSSDFGEACRTWRDSVNAGMGACEQYPERCLTVRQEDLTAAPDETFRTIFLFLQAGFESRPVQYWRSNRINSSFKHDATNKSAVSEGERAWSHWSDSERQIFVDEAGEAMARYRYPVARSPVSSA
jgi:hypothetical protein